MILGFTGTFAAGKGTVIGILESDYKAKSYSLSDEVRAECKKRGLSNERKNLIFVGNDMRSRHGGGYFAKVVAEYVKEDHPDWKKRVICIDSIRAPEEVDELRKQFGDEFKLVAVDAPVEIRYERSKTRGRAKEQLLSFEEFVQSERKEQSKAQNEASIWRTMEKADIRIINDGNMPELKKKISELIRA